MLAFYPGEGLLDPVQRIKDDLPGDAFVAVADEEEVVDGEDLVEGAQEVGGVAIVKFVAFVRTVVDLRLQVLNQVAAGAPVEQLAEFYEALIFLVEQIDGGYFGLDNVGVGGKVHRNGVEK